MTPSMHSQIAARESDCWPPINQLLLKTTAVAALVVAMLCGCSKSPKTFRQMSEADQLNFLRAQADSAMLVQVTNGVLHFHNVIEANADTFGGSVDQWRGWVRLDYTDKSGAVQQTNIPMTFVATFDGRLFSSASTAGSGSPLMDLQ
jgi:hypothetical protein